MHLHICMYIHMQPHILTLNHVLLNTCMQTYMHKMSIFLPRKMYITYACTQFSDFFISIISIHLEICKSENAVNTGIMDIW